MKSIRRCQHIISLFILIFIAGMAGLVFKLQHESPFYMMNSDNHELGRVYDRHGEILFNGSSDGNWADEYGDNYFIDIGNLIGDDKGQMTNTLVARNIEKLNNYSFSGGLVSDGGKSAIYTTLDHKANRAVYDSFLGNKGCAVAYNYKTGEILVCTSLPSIDVTKGYGNIDALESGTLISKTMYRTVPGSTQKVSTVIAALEIMGAEKLFSKSFNCSGKYINKSGDTIDCHEFYGHGTLTIQQAVEKSCNPFFAQLIEDGDLPLSKLKKIYKRLGYAVNDDKINYIDIDGIKCESASTTLTDPNDFQTQWGCLGQGDTLVSPIQLMMWQSAIANGTGKMTMPYLIDEVTNVRGKITERAETTFSDRLFSEETSDTIRQILLTNGANNYTYAISGYTIGVKSGTAQVDEGKKENSLLTGFVDDPMMPVAFCVLLEDRNSTSLKAEQIVKVMLDALSSK